MATATIATGAFPTGSPGSLSATYLSSARGIAEVSSTDSRAQVLLLVYGSGNKWWPVKDAQGAPIIITVDATNTDPIRAAYEGNQRVEFDVAQPAYYLLWRISAQGTVAGYLSDASSGSFASADTKLVAIGAPLAASGTAVHAALAGNAAVAFPGPFTNPDVPCNVTAVFAGSYDGGDITITGTDQFGAPQTETIAANAGSTVAGNKIFATVTSAVRSTVGGTANTVSLGRGTKLGFKDQLSSVVVFVDGAVEAPSAIDYTRYSFTPTTAPNGSHVYQIIGSK